MPTSLLQTRIHRLGFHGEHGEDAFVYPSQRFTVDESVQGFEAEGEFTARQGPLRPEAPLPQTRKVLLGRCIRDRR